MSTHKLIGTKKSTETKQKMSISHIGLCWWNNGDKEYRSKDHPGAGFHRGRLPKMRTFTDGYQIIHSREKKIDGYFEGDWLFDRLQKKMADDCN